MKIKIIRSGQTDGNCGHHKSESRSYLLTACLPTDSSVQKLASISIRYTYWFLFFKQFFCKDLKTLLIPHTFESTVHHYSTYWSLFLGGIVDGMQTTKFTIFKLKCLTLLYGVLIPALQHIWMYWTARNKERPKEGYVKYLLLCRNKPVASAFQLVKRTNLNFEDFWICHWRSTPRPLRQPRPRSHSATPHNIIFHSLPREKRKVGVWCFYRCCLMY